MNSWIEPAANHFQAAHFTALFLDAWIKSFVVLALAAGTCALWRRASAATRHLIWLLAMAGLPCLPLLTATLPTWQKPLWSVSTASVAGSQVALGLEFAPGSRLGAAAAEPQTPPATSKEINAGRDPSIGNPKFTAHFGASWLVLGFVVWAAGIFLVLLSITIGQLRLHQFSRRAQAVHDADWTTLLQEAGETLQLRRAVKLLQSAESVMPLTWGWWRPVVLLPAEADHWSLERGRIVLLHELAHVKRWDCLTQLGAKSVCALFWFNPLVWLAARQMRVERERACDDLVLNSGCKASDYAGHLVDIAQSFRRIPQVAAIAMARPSGLEQRVEAILDGRRNRSRIAKLTVAGLVAAFLSLGWLIGSYAAENSSLPWSLKNSKVADQLKHFVAEKQAQEGTLIEADEKSSPESGSNTYKLLRPDCQPFFAAAAAGDWPALTNVWSDLEAHTLGLSKVTNGYPHGMWLQTMRETFGAIEAFAVGNEKHSRAFADGVIQSIPSGSVYFGGTDHGRFIITAMQKSQVQGDPFFTLTQNALADRTYLDYLRSMVDGEIYIPTSEDSQKCFQDYIAGAQVRLKENRLKPGENFKVTQGRIQVSGATAVMEINALLVKIIFDKNPGREFFIEESFPLDWMYPNLEPHGFIFKINRQPLAELSEAMVQQDRAHWQKVLSGAIGNWLKDDTSVQEVTEFAERVFVRHDLHGFTGDPGFVQNDYSSRMFSKLRSSIAGLYAWRAEHAVTSGEKQRLTRAADFAFRQAVALCPISPVAVPEAVKNYAAFLKSQHREADAQLVQSLADRSKSKIVSIFQMRRVVDETATDAEKMTMLNTNKTTGQAFQQVLFVEKQALLDQADLQSAKLIAGNQAEPQIEITFTSAGREKFGQVTRELLHERLAIIVDGRLMSTPHIQSEITSGIGQITGSFSEAEAAALAEKLNAAAGK